MFKGLDRRTTKTGQGDWQSKGYKTLSSVKDTVGDFPVQVNNLAVHVKEGKRAPRSRPMKDTKRRRKLNDTMRLNNVLG